MIKIDLLKKACGIERYITTWTNKKPPSAKRLTKLVMEGFHSSSNLANYISNITYYKGQNRALVEIIWI